MFSIILVLIVVSALAWLYYWQIYAPRKLHHQLNEEFSKKQWKVYSHPFKPFKFTIHDTHASDSQEETDALSFEKYTASKYDVNLANLFSKQFIFLQHPTLIKEFYKLDSEDIMKKDSFSHQSILRLIGRGLTYAQGSLWKEKRKVMSKFLNFEFLKHKNPRILQFVQRQFNRFFSINQLQGSKDKQNSPQGYLLEIFESIPAQYVNEIYFGGSKLDFELSQIDGISMPREIDYILKKVFDHAEDPIPRLLGFLKIPFLKLGLRKKDREVNAKIKKFRDVTADLFRTRIKQIQEEINDSTFLKDPRDMTQAFYFNSRSKKQKMNKQSFIKALVNDYIDLMHASSENVGITCLMLVYYLQKSPERKSRLIQELESEFKVLDTENVEKLKELKYLQCCVTETLRLYQSVSGMFPRKLLTDIELDGITIKRGSIVSVPFFQVHYRELLYKDANEFRPERWLDEKGEIIKTDFSTFVTFGAGPRNCIGRNLTFAQIRIFVAYFFMNFQAEFETLDLKMTKHAEDRYEPRPIKMKLRRKNQQKHN